MTTKREIWKVRAVKPYPDAHNHLLIGQMLEHDASHVRMTCRTFHYGRLVNSVKDIGMGEIATRRIPWDRIEIVNELTSGFDFKTARLRMDAQGKIHLTDGDNSCLIASVGSTTY